MVDPKKWMQMFLRAKRLDPAPTWFRDASELAVQIAGKIFPHHSDRQRRDELTVLLAAFAAEIKRSAIEP